MRNAQFNEEHLRPLREGNPGVHPGVQERLEQILQAVGGEVAAPIREGAAGDEEEDIVEGCICRVEVVRPVGCEREALRLRRGVGQALEEVAHGGEGGCGGYAAATATTTTNSTFVRSERARRENEKRGAKRVVLLLRFVASLLIVSKANSLQQQQQVLPHWKRRNFALLLHEGL